MIATRRPDWRDLLAIVFPLLLAVAVYRPWHSLPFDIWDFQEFLPILAARDGLADQYRALLAYYASHGRMNPLFYATFVAQYDWFGLDPRGWQLLRFALMAVNGVLVYAVARRLGIGRIGGAAAVTLLVVATPAVRAWVQLMAEPQVVCALLGATLLALDYGSRERWQGRAVAICALIAVVFLSKEVDGVLGIVVVGIAVLSPVRHGGAVRWRAPRNIALVAGAGLVAVAAAALLIWVRSQPQATGYGMAYGSGDLTPSRLAAIMVASVMPVRPAAGILPGLVYPVNLLTLAVIVAGGVLATRRHARHLAGKAVLALAPAVLAAAAFLPWPKFDTFYALPFFLGAALLVAAAIDEIARVPRWGRAVAVACVVAIGVYGAVPADRSTAAATAALRLNDFFARHLARFGPGDTVLVVGPADGVRELPVRAEELREYAIALGHVPREAAPTVISVPCNAFDPTQPVTRERVAFVSYSYGCGRFPQPVLRIASPYAWRVWTTLRAVADSMTIDLVGPAATRSMRR